MRSSGGVSMRIRVPLSSSTTAPTRVLRSRGSGERHTAHPHPSWGTPKLVPVPRKVSFMGRGNGNENGNGNGKRMGQFSSSHPHSYSDRFNLDHVRRTGNVE